MREDRRAAVRPAGRSRAVLLAAAVFAVALGAHVPAALQYRSDPFSSALVSDASSYDEWAMRIARDGVSREPVFHQAPLYPLMLAAIYRAVEAEGRLWAAVSVQMLLGSLAVAFLVPIGRRYLGSTPAGVAAACAVLLHATFVFHDLKILPISIALVTQAGALALLGEARMRPSSGWAAIAGLSWGLAVLARAEVIAFVPLAVLAVGLGTEDGAPAQGRWKRAVILLAAALVGIAPATLHNLRRGDFVVVAYSGGENLYAGNRKGAEGGHAAIDPRAGDLFSSRILAGKIAEETLGRELRPSEISAFWRARAVREIVEDPREWMALLGRKLRRILDPGDPNDLYSMPLERDRYLPALHLMPVSPWVILAAAAAGLYWTLRRHPRTSWPLAAFAGVHGLLLLTFFVSTRLRLPFLFAVAPFAGFAVTEAWGRWRRREGRAVVAALAGTLLILAVVGWAATRSSPRDRVRLASVLSTSGRLEEALAVLADDLASSAPDPLVLDQAGWVHQKRGDASAARDLYRKALARGMPDGRSTSTRTRLAVVLEATGRRDEAGLEHDRAVASSGANAGTWYERGMFRLRQGDREGARADLERAATLDPSWAAPRAALSTTDGGVNGRAAGTPRDASD